MVKARVLLFGSLMSLILLTGQAFAAIDAYQFPNEQMRERYRVLIEELRCPQCLNTNIAGSDAMIAKDLRREVHRLLLEGKTNDEILEYMHKRYGDFILYKPRLEPGTLVLWFGPGILFLIALVVFIRFVRQKAAAQAEQQLTASEEERLSKLIGDGKS